jgi:hypothetical protein
LNSTIYTGKEIASALSERWDAVLQYVEDMPDHAFEQAPEGKWTPGQHLEHLLRAAVPLRKGLGYPRFVIRWVAGTPNRPSRTFEETLARYQEKISKGGRATGRFIPPAVPLSRKAELLRVYAQEKDRMVRKLSKWSEKNLDAYLLPHPLLGKVTVREMMFFTAFHTEIHLDILKRDAAQG